jgi:hypothetical protein
MRGRFRIWYLLALLVLCLVVVALLGFSQRELISTQVIGDGHLQGLVVDEEGNPVSEVPVSLVVQRSSGLNCSTKECDLFNAPVFFPLEATDTQGSFSIHVPRRYLADGGKPSMYIYKLQVEVTPHKTKFFYKLDLARHEANTQTFEVKPPFLTSAAEIGSEVEG